MSTNSYGLIMSDQVSAIVPYADFRGEFVPASHVWYKTNKNKYNEYTHPQRTLDTIILTEPFDTNDNIFYRFHIAHNCEDLSEMQKS